MKNNPEYLKLHEYARKKEKDLHQDKLMNNRIDPIQHIKYCHELSPDCFLLSFWVLGRKK